MKTLSRIICACGVVGIMIAPSFSVAQSWPGKPVRLIVPVPPGGANDLVARLVAAKLAEAFGQPVVVENQGGAGTIIGTAAVARSAPDGHTLLLTSTSHVTTFFLSKSLPYDPIKDFTPITAVAEIIGCIVVNSSAPFNNVKEMVDFSIRNPGKVAFGSPGIGTTFHLIGELFNQITGANLVHVPYKGTAPAMADLIGGQIPVVFTSVSTIPKGQSGKVRVLAILESRRYPGLQNVPTVGETIVGFQKPVSWFGLMGPAKLPQSVVGRLHAETVKALKFADVHAKLDAASLGVLASSPEEFSDMIRAGMNAYGKIVKAVGIKPE